MFPVETVLEKGMGQDGAEKVHQQYAESWVLQLRWPLELPWVVMKGRVLHAPNSDQSSSKTLGGRRHGLGWGELTAEGSLLAAFPVTWIVRPLFLKGKSWHPYHGIYHTAAFWICHWSYPGLISHSSHLSCSLRFYYQSHTLWSKPSGSLLPTE